MIDKYDIFMQELIVDLTGTWVDAGIMMPKKGAMQGSTEDEITAVEQEIGKQLPAALKAWYQVAGEVPPDINNYDLDYSLADFKRAQETAADFAQWFEESEKKRLSEMMPFSQRIGEVCLFLELNHDNVDDPPVFISVEAEPLQQVDIAFTTYIRETCMSFLEPEVPGIRLSYEPEIRKYRRGLYEQAQQIRKELIEIVHQEDLVRDTITGVQGFQERWLNHEPAIEIGRKIENEGLLPPYNWKIPPQYRED